MAMWYKKKLIDVVLKCETKVKTGIEKITPSKKTVRKVKVFCYKVLALAGVLLLAYTYGTFNPNSIVEEKIRKQEDKRMVEMAKQFGLHEPEFKYDGPKTFVQAMNKMHRLHQLDTTAGSKNTQRHIGSNGNNRI
jgi:hypothetical protein